METEKSLPQSQISVEIAGCHAAVGHFYQQIERLMKRTHMIRQAKSEKCRNGENTPEIPEPNLCSLGNEIRSIKNRIDIASNKISFIIEELQI